MESLGGLEELGQWGWLDESFDKKTRPFNEMNQDFGCNFSFFVVFILLVAVFQKYEQFEDYAGEGMIDDVMYLRAEK